MFNDKKYLLLIMNFVYEKYFINKNYLILNILYIYIYIKTKSDGNNRRNYCYN